jgi:hypothetical protein
MPGGVGTYRGNPKKTLEGKLRQIERDANKRTEERAAKPVPPYIVTPELKKLMAKARMRERGRGGR